MEHREGAKDLWFRVVRVFRGWASLCGGWSEPRLATCAVVVLSAILLWGVANAQVPAIRLQVDASDAPRRILHSKLEIPVQAGKLTLLYPKWIPGEHGPTGPLNDLVGLTITADGKSIAWERDPDEMFAFNLVVPQGVKVLEVGFDFLMTPMSAASTFSAGASASDRLLVINWNQVLLYPKGPKAMELRYAAGLELPRNWKFGTALAVASESSQTVEFAPVSLERLVDSPVLAGINFRTFDLTPGEKPPHYMDVAADSPTTLEAQPETVRLYSRLVAETGALFGARHYESYHFLLSVSDHVAHYGLEHHESSDNRSAEKSLTLDSHLRGYFAWLVPHEMVHSWNGKFRRPAGFATADYQQPMRGELLWVYEGLTDYLGAILTVRCGLWTNSLFREYLALEAATLDRERGRNWRPLSDTTVAAQVLYQARAEDVARRRGLDFYSEGDLIWLDADVVIRQQTQGRRSLDDFCRTFFGGESGAPKVVSYTADNVLKTLDLVASYNWREFIQARVYRTNSHAPLGGIEGAGWRLAYTNIVSEWLRGTEADTKTTDLRFCLGFLVKEDGCIQDVIPGSPADRAGIGSGMKLIAVNGRRWTVDLLRATTKATATGGSLELLVENADFFKTCKLDFHEGEKYPILVRDSAKPDLLSEILKPRGNLRP